MDDQSILSVRSERAVGDHTAAPKARHQRTLRQWLLLASITVLTFMLGGFAAADALHPSQAGVFDRVPIEQYVGLRFIFLDRPQSLQQYGYMEVTRSPESHAADDGALPFLEAVGRIGRVVSVTRPHILPIVQLEMEDNGQNYFVEVHLGSMYNLGPVSDIEHAKALYQGSTLWLNRVIPRVYDPASESFGSVDARRFTQVRVVDVVPSWYDFAPVRFVVETREGEQGWLDVNLSGTNAGDILFDTNRFDDFFFVHDPRIFYDWPESVWSAIDEESVFIGMTADQARLAWGNPTSVHSTATASGTREQWVYGDGLYLYFQDGILDTIQN